MNGQRMVRKYLERLTVEELQGLNEAAKNDDTQEGLCIRYLSESELAYRMEKKRKEIQKALDQLGVSGYSTTKWIAGDRIAVYLDDEYFGIWDTTRKTFVD